MTNKNSAELEEQIWYSIRQQLQLPEEAGIIYRLAAFLGLAGGEADLTAWETHMNGKVFFSSHSGMLTHNDELNDLLSQIKPQQRNRLRESVARISDELSQEEVIAAMLEICQRETPEIYPELKAFLTSED